MKKYILYICLWIILPIMAFAGPPSPNKVSNEAYNATTWDGVTTKAPSKNAVRDKVETLQTAITGTDTHVMFFDGADSPAGEAGMTYNKTTNTLTTDTFVGALTGNSSTATTLETARTIGNQSFDGSANISPDRLFEGDTVTALTVGDATPEVATKNLYDCTGGTTITITDFVDSDGDHSEFSDGDYFGVLMNDGDVIIDFSDNANIEGNVNTDFTGSTSQIVLLTFVFQGSAWYCDFNSGFSDPTTMSVRLKVQTVTDADGFTMTEAQGYGYTVYATGAGVITMPPVASGMQFTVECHTDGNVDLNPDASGTEDTIRLDGQALAQGDAIRGTNYGDAVTCTYYATDTWSCISGSKVTSGWEDVN